MTETNKPDRSAKLNRKLRASETERVRLVRELDRVRKQAIAWGKLLNAANAEIKRLRKLTDGG